MKRLRIALVAHDARKQELVDWCRHNAQWLDRHVLFGTGTTASLLNEIMVPVIREEGIAAPDCEALPLSVFPLMSGPLGGDQQIGAMLACGELDLIVFLRDPLTAQPHEPDVSALLRLCDVQSIPLATNVSSAIIMLESIENKKLFN